MTRDNTKNLDDLLKKHERDPTDGHVIYQIAELYFTKFIYMTAIIYYKKRVSCENNENSINDKGEVIDSYIKIGQCYDRENNRKEFIKYMWMAYEHDNRIIDPLLFISERYLYEKRFSEAYYILKIACEAKYPNDLDLFVSRSGYLFNRYDLMSRAAEQMNEYKDCESACENALKYLYMFREYPDRSNTIHKLFEIYENNRIKMLSCMYQEYSHKPVILIFGGREDNNKQWNGNSQDLSGCGTSAVFLAEELQHNGYKVVVCCDTKDRVICRDIEYIRLSDYEPFLREYFVEHLIVLRCSIGVRYYSNIKNVYIWCQDQSVILPPDGDRFDLSENKLKYVIALSEWHENYIKSITPSNFKYMIKHIGNSIVPERFELSNTPKRKSMRFIYSSCPSRGLSRLIPLFKKIHKVYPQATLEIFCDFDSKHVKKRTNAYNLKQDVSRTEGITNHGRVNQEQLVKEMMSSDYWIYLTTFKETYCISALEAQAAGCICLYSPIGALPDVIGNRGISIDSDEDKEVIDSITYLEDNSDIKEEMRKDSRKWALKQDYKDRAKKWIELFKGETPLNVCV